MDRIEALDRGPGAAIYIYLAAVYTTFGIRVRPTRPGFLYGLLGALQHYTIVPLGRTKPSSDFSNSTQYLFQGMSHVVVSLRLDMPTQLEFKDLP
jgi:hypothetical protein